MNYKITNNSGSSSRIKKKKIIYLVISKIKINPSRENWKTRSLKISHFNSHYLVKINLNGLINYLKVKMSIKLDQKEV